MPKGLGYGKKTRKQLSSKIQKVKRDDPGLSNKQAAGRAAGILRGKKKKK